MCDLLYTGDNRSMNYWLTCWLDSCSSQGKLQSCQCAWRCPWTSRPDSVPTLGTSLPSSAPAHPPYEGYRGTLPHSWIQNTHLTFTQHKHKSTELTWLIFSCMEMTKKQCFILSSMQFVLKLSCCLAAHMPSSPPRASSRDCVLWPRENLHWRTLWFVGHLSTAAREQAWKQQPWRPESQLGCFQPDSSVFSGKGT